MPVVQDNVQHSRTWQHKLTAYSEQIILSFVQDYFCASGPWLGNITQHVFLCWWSGIMHNRFLHLSMGLGADSEQIIVHVVQYWGIVHNISICLLSRITSNKFCAPQDRIRGWFRADHCMCCSRTAGNDAEQILGPVVQGLGIMHNICL